MKKSVSALLIMILIFSISTCSGTLLAVADVAYGTKDNPLVKNTNNTPVVVQGDMIGFPGDMQIFDTAKFNGVIDGAAAFNNTTSVTYSGNDGTYYGTTAGSAAVKIESFGVRLAGQYYSAMQFRKDLKPITAASLASSSVAFWINAPEDMYLRMHLFAYRHSGSSGDINFYSDEIELKKGTNLIEIPMANFTVSSTNSVDLTQTLKIYATRFCFRNLDDGEDITGKTVYVDNIGIYFNQNSLGDYKSAYGTQGYPVVENEKSTPIIVKNSDVDFPEGLQIINSALFSGSIDGMNNVSNSSEVAYSNEANTYYGATAGSAAIKVKNFDVKLINKNYSAAQLRKDLVSIPADKLANSSIAFWINAPEDMYLRMHLFAYRHSGTSGDIGFYSEEIKIEKGISFVEIPLANFTVNTTNSVDLTQILKIYATRFCFRSTEDGTDITDKTVYVDNIGIYFNQNTSSDYVASFGTTGNPVVENENNNPIIVQGDEKSFPEGMLINNNAKFSGSAESAETVADTSVVSYSKDTYYGKYAGSIAVKLENYGIKLADKQYSAMQFRKELKEISATAVRDASVAFWVNAPENMNLRVHLFAYRHSGTSGDINFYSDEIEINKGANFVEIPLANFIVNSTNTIDPTQNLKIYATRFCFRGVEDGADIVGKTVYIDNIGIYSKQNEASDYKELVNGGEVEEPSVEGKATHNEQAYVENSSWQVSDETISTYAPIHNSSKDVLQSESNEHPVINDFAKDYEPVWNFEDSDLGWKEHNTSTFNISKSTEKSYKGTALKLFYDKETAKDEFPRVLCSKASVRTVGYDGIAVWVYSEKDITLSCLGVMNNCGKTSQLNLTVKKGGQILLFPFEEFSNFDAFKGETKTISQLQFMGINFKADTTLYIDHVGLYKNEDTKAVNENAYGGIGKSVKISTKDETIMPVGTVQRFDINFKSALTDREKNKWGTEATLAIWIKTNRALNVKVGAGASIAWKPATGENHWFSEVHTVPKGESILRIPLTEFINKQNGWSYTTDTPDWSNYIGRLIFQVSSLNDIELEMYIDQIALEYPVKTVTITPEYLEKDTFVWWDFDQYDKTEDMGKDWETRWAGETNEGITLDIEKNKENVYGKNGNSLKLSYDSAFAEWGIPVVWHQEQMTVYGDGITFWFKSLENMEIDIYAAAVVSGVDKWPIVKVTGIPVKYGENVITVKYDDFVLDSKDGGKVPEFTKLAQFQIRLKKCTSGTAWLDSVGFSGVVNDGSNQYKFLNPPTSYSKFEKGIVSVTEDFENHAEDDLDFCTDWYYEDTGWITLENSAGNKKLRMDYNMTEKKSVLKNITYFEGVDPAGGISFWLKSSENRNYGVSMTIGGSNVTVVIKGTTAGKVYNIPFSAFWDSRDINKSFEAATPNLVTITRMEFATDSTYNPPANGVSSKCSVWIDDIKFVDSLNYKRAASVDYSENGVRLIASAEAFTSGVSPKFSIVELSDEQKSKYIAQMKNADTVWREFDLKAIDTKGVNAIPTRQIELIFDLPEDVEPQNISVWQKYFDGSVLKINSKLADDGKLHVQTYKLGNYILAYNSNAVVEKNEDVEVDVKNNNVPVIIVIVAVAVIVLVSGTIAVFFVVKKKGAGK